MPLSRRPHIQTSPLDLSVWDSDTGVDPGFNLLETTHKGWGQFRFTVEIPDSKLTPNNLPAERFSSSGGDGGRVCVSLPSAVAQIPPCLSYVDAASLSLTGKASAPLIIRGTISGGFLGGQVFQALLGSLSLGGRPVLLHCGLYLHILTPMLTASGAGPHSLSVSLSVFLSLSPAAGT